jgi:hypothetical protein
LNREHPAQVLLFYDFSFTFQKSRVLSNNGRKQTFPESDKKIAGKEVGSVGEPEPTSLWDKPEYFSKRSLVTNIRA